MNISTPITTTPFPAVQLAFNALMSGGNLVDTARNLCRDHGLTAREALLAVRTANAFRTASQDATSA